MIEVVISNLTPKSEAQFIIISRIPDLPYGDLSLELTEVTTGAAATVLLAATDLSLDDEVIVANCDQIVDIDINDFIHHARGGDGCIMTFPSDEEKWSYAKLENGFVSEVAEKKVISNHATVGIYYFKKVAYLITAITEMIKANKRTNGEFYLCPAYNELIDRGFSIGIYEIGIEQMHGLGTPEDYENYCNNL